MRLIDADVLMADVRNTITEESGAIDWINLINCQPTGYDPDKVVEQLEDMKSTYQRLRDLKDRDYLKYGYIIETLIDAIKIVKDGGVDAQNSREENITGVFQ